MRISELLHTRVVLPGVAARTKDDVLELLAARLAGEYPEIDQPQLTAALRERERQMTTALADGVAIPHARLGGLRRMVAAFGRSAAGIDCGSHDGKPTHFFLLLVVPEESPGTHLKVLATASRLLHDPRCRARLLQAPDEDTLLDALRTEEGRTRGAARAA
jgi:mannitol/fructose-specific phosphotransferase system IIA component (Ntr-type)